MLRKAMYTLFRGYIDDSEHKGMFTLSCLSAKPTTWTWVSIDWETCLEKKNEELKKRGRKTISRYHASDCSNGYKEFKGWSKPEIDDFTKELLGVFAKPSSDGLQVFASSVSLRDIETVFPEASPDPPAFANALMLHCIMLEMAGWIAKANKPEDYSQLKVALVHERGDYNATLRRVFDTTKVVSPLCRTFFTTLVPMGWEDCLQLQPADLLAYEECKERERNPAERPKMRRSLEKIQSTKEFGGITKGFTLERLQKARKFVTQELWEQFLLDANLARKRTTEDGQLP